MKSKILTTILFCIFATTSVAHAPVVNDKNLAYSIDAPFEIDDPEHSLAIFSELQGAPQYFRISADEPFRFYVGITQAKLETCPMQRSFSFDILDENMKKIDGRDGNQYEWWPWYEEYGKTWYWVGPEIGADFKGDRTYEAGVYWVRVFNQDNEGKYVLSVGDVEKFGVRVIAGMLVNRTMSKVRNGWWDEDLCGD